MAVEVKLCDLLDTDDLPENTGGKRKSKHAGKRKGRKERKTSKACRMPSLLCYTVVAYWVGAPWAVSTLWVRAASVMEAENLALERMLERERGLMSADLVGSFVPVAVLRGWHRNLRLPASSTILPT